MVILDLGLPDLDGLEVARRLRKGGLESPILILTARADEVDAVVGLDAGADDYVTKPFRLGELQARIRAQMRRAEDVEEAGDAFVVNGVSLNVSARPAYVVGQELKRAAQEHDLATDAVI